MQLPPDSVFPLSPASAMENIITSHYSDDLPESRKVVESGTQHHPPTYSESGRLQKDGEQVSRSPIIDQEGGFVLVDSDPPTFISTQGSSGNRGMHLVGLQNGSVGPLRSIMKPAPVTGRKNGVLLSEFDTTPRNHLNRCPPGTFDHAQYHDEDPDIPSTSLGNEQEEISNDPIPNIVLFGETGVGKSSIMNLIADQKLAHTSNDTVGCTFQHKQYHVTLGNMKFAIWDTTGLDEGTEGTVPAKLAEKNLADLIRGLAHSGGIHLIIYCIRGSRLTKALKRNYDLFYDTICGKNAPVALVVTGLELEEDMEAWWTTNEAVLRRYGMQFDAHACVTTVDVEDDFIQQRRSESQAQLRELVVEYSGRSGWKIDPSIISWLMPRIHSGLSRILFAGRAAPVRKVTVCGSFTEFMPEIANIWDKHTQWIRDKQYEFVWVDKHALHALTPITMEELGGRGAGVLVFYASPPVELRIPQNDIEALRKFYSLAGGHSRVIVVLRGYDDEVARMCSGEFASHHRDIQPYVISLPGTLEEVQAGLNMTIDILYDAHPFEVKSSSLWRKLLKVLGCFGVVFPGDEHY